MGIRQDYNFYAANNAKGILTPEDAKIFGEYNRMLFALGCEIVYEDNTPYLVSFKKSVRKRLKGNPVLVRENSSDEILGQYKSYKEYKREFSAEGHQTVADDISVGVIVVHQPNFNIVGAGNGTGLIEISQIFDYPEEPTEN